MSYSIKQLKRAISQIGKPIKESQDKAKENLPESDTNTTAKSSQKEIARDKSKVSEVDSKAKPLVNSSIEKKASNKSKVSIDEVKVNIKKQFSKEEIEEAKQEFSDARNCVETWLTETGFLRKYLRKLYMRKNAHLKLGHKSRKEMVKALFKGVKKHRSTLNLIVHQVEVEVNLGLKSGEVSGIALTTVYRSAERKDWSAIYELGIEMCGSNDKLTAKVVNAAAAKYFKHSEKLAAVGSKPESANKNTKPVAAKAKPEKQSELVTSKQDKPETESVNKAKPVDSKAKAKEQSEPVKSESAKAKNAVNLKHAEPIVSKCDKPEAEKPKAKTAKHADTKSGNDEKNIAKLEDKLVEDQNKPMPKKLKTLADRVLNTYNRKEAQRFYDIVEPADDDLVGQDAVTFIAASSDDYPLDFIVKQLNKKLSAKGKQ